MTGLPVLRMIAVQGASQVAVTALHVLVWPGIALAIALPALAWRRYHQRRTRITHMVTLPPGGEIGDDVIAMIREARAQDRTEAEADADYEREIAEMIERYGNG